MQFFKVVNASCACGGQQAWMEVRPDGVEVMLGCICHNTLPTNAGVFGTHIQGPYKDDPMPLNFAARQRWKERNFLRNYGTFNPRIS